VSASLPVARRVDTEWTAGALDERRTAGESFPITEPGVCTFAFCGPVISVRLAHFGVGLPEDLAFEPLEESEWWVLALALPDGTRLEYKLDVVDSFGNRFIEDPLNPNVASHPFGANSVCEAFGYVEPLWAQQADDVPRGTYTDIGVWSDAYGRDTAVTVYRAATVDGPAPVVIVHDGGDYLRYADAGTVLDNLVHGGVIPPVVAAFIQPQERLVEYADDPRHATYLTKELVPRLEADFEALAEPDARCLVGASFGAVASLASAATAPGFFGRLLLQSGSFAGAGHGCRPRPEPLWRPVQRFVAGLVARPEVVSERIFVSCGAYESLICENRALVPVLSSTGMDVRFVESLGGHNWACWRDTIGQGLPWLLRSTE
jgi:enterochelin esterase family protein